MLITLTLTFKPCRLTSQGWNDSSTKGLCNKLVTQIVLWSGRGRHSLRAHSTHVLNDSRWTSVDTSRKRKQTTSGNRWAPVEISKTHKIWNRWKPVIVCENQWTNPSELILSDFAPVCWVLTGTRRAGWDEKTPGLFVCSVLGSRVF